MNIALELEAKRSSLRCSRQSIAKRWCCAAAAVFPNPNGKKDQQNNRFAVFFCQAVCVLHREREIDRERER